MAEHPPQVAQAPPATSSVTTFIKIVQSTAARQPQASTPRSLLSVGFPAETDWVFRVGAGDCSALDSLAQQGASLQTTGRPKRKRMVLLCDEDDVSTRQRAVQPSLRKRGRITVTMFPSPRGHSRRVKDSDNAPQSICCACTRLIGDDSSDFVAVELDCHHVLCRPCFRHHLSRHTDCPRCCHVFTMPARVFRVHPVTSHEIPLATPQHDVVLHKTMMSLLASRQAAVRKDFGAQPKLRDAIMNMMDAHPTAAVRLVRRLRLVGPMLRRLQQWLSSEPRSEAERALAGRCSKALKTAVDVVKTTRPHDKCPGMFECIRTACDMFGELGIGMPAVRENARTTRDSAEFHECKQAMMRLMPSAPPLAPPFRMFPL